MTQAFNLSQLANNLDSSGRLDATDGLVNAVPVANGGTGAANATSARSNLDVPTRAGGDATGTWAIDITGNAATSSSCSGNAATATYATTAGSAGAVADNSVNTNQIVNSAVTPAKIAQPLTTTASVNTTSGSSNTLTGIPSWVKRVQIVLRNVSTNGTGVLIFQLGTSAGIVSTGYSGCFNYGGGGGSPTDGIGISASSASDVRNGIITLVNTGSNVWVAAGVTAISGPGITSQTGYTVTLPGALTQIRLTTTGAGTDLFDGGSFMVIYD